MGVWYSYFKPGEPLKKWHSLVAGYFRDTKQLFKNEILIWIPKDIERMWGYKKNSNGKKLVFSIHELYLLVIVEKLKWIVKCEIFIFRRLTHSLPAFFLENIQWSDKSNYRSIFRLKVNYNGFFTRSWKMQTNNGIKLNSICGNGIFPGWVGLTRVFQGSYKGSERDTLIQCPHFWLIMSAI